MELMVAIVLTGFITWLTLSLFANENRSYTKTRERVRLQTDSREALRLIEQEVRNMGYKTTVAISANRVQSSIGTCADVWMDAPGGDSSSFGFENTKTLAGDSISFLFHELQNGPLTDCTNLRTIGYRQYGSLLQRRWCNGGCTNEPWIGLLDSVVSFQIRYGLIANPTDYSSLNSPAQLQTSALWTRGTMTKSGTSPDLVLGGFTTLRKTAIFSSPIDTLDPTQTWEISFTSLPNDALLADMDSTSFKVGFYKSDGSVTGTGDTMSFSTGFSSGTPRTLAIQISPTTYSAGGLYLGFEGKLKTSTKAAWGLTLSSISLRRVSRGKYNWVENPTIAQKNKVRAIDIHLLVKARKTTQEASPGPFDSVALGQSGLSYTPTGTDVNRSFVIFQRVIPVVNNGI